MPRAAAGQAEAVANPARAAARPSADRAACARPTSTAAATTVNATRERFRAATRRGAWSWRPTTAAATTTGVRLGYYYYNPWSWYAGYGWPGYAGWPGYYGNLGYYGSVGVYGPYGGAYYGGGYGAYGGPYGYSIGGVRLRVNPKDAEVYVDGYYAGIVDDFDGTWQQLRLDDGAYRIEIRKPGLATLTFDVQIQPGRTITYRGDMLGPP